VDAGVYVLSSGIPTTTVVADVDQDGFEDVVIGTAGGIEVWYGLGLGRFGDSATYALGSVASLTVAQLRPGQGPDLIAAVGADVLVLTNAGHRAFADAGSIWSFHEPVQAVAAGDLEGWGVDVVAVALPDSGTVVLPQIPGAMARFSGSPLLSLAFGDFNRDGLSDLVISQSGGSPDISWIFGARDAGLHSSTVSFGPSGPTAMAVTDLNNDGFQDLVVAGASLSFYLGGAGLGINPRPTLDLGECSASALLVASFTRPGFPDLAFICKGSVELMSRSTSGSFAPPLTVSSGTTATSLGAGDLDGDGIPDLIVTSAVLPAAGAFQVLLDACP